jgi:hypothetical protein
MTCRTLYSPLARTEHTKSWLEGRFTAFGLHTDMYITMVIYTRCDNTGRSNEVLAAVQAMDVGPSDSGKADGSAVSASTGEASLFRLFSALAF